MGKLGKNKKTKGGGKGMKKRKRKILPGGRKKNFG